jgi:hypothetical protein
MKNTALAQKHDAKAKRALEIIRAAERGIIIEFNDAVEARLYREAYVKTHTGIIEAEVIEVMPKLIGE